MTSSKVITPVGIGRVDYSTNIERSVEVTTRSWQSDYLYEQSVVALGPYDSIVIPVAVTSGHVALIYDLRLSTTAHVLIGLDIQENVVGVGWVSVFSGLGYSRILEHITNGYPVLAQYRIIVTNWSALTLDLEVSLNGIDTTLDELTAVYKAGGLPP